jgi:predicted XRE-type DNA-binding protein
MNYYGFLVERINERNEKFEEAQKVILSENEISEEEISEIFKSSVSFFTIDEMINFSKYVSDSQDDKDSEESIFKLLEEWIKKTDI